MKIKNFLRYFRFKRNNKKDLVEQKIYLRCKQCSKKVLNKFIFIHSIDNSYYCCNCIKNIGLVNFNSTCNHCFKGLFNPIGDFNCFDSVIFLSFDRNLNTISLCPNCFDIEYSNYNFIDKKIVDMDINDI